MKKFANLILVAGAAAALSACACVNAGEQRSHASNQTAGEMPTYSKDCKPGAKSAGGDKMFSGKQHK